MTVSPLGTDTAVTRGHHSSVALLGNGLEWPGFAWPDPDVLDVTITLDEAWSPHVQAEVTVAMPPAEVLALIDARQDMLMSVSAGYDVNNEAYSWTLWLRGAEPDWAEGTLKLTGMSAECLMADTTSVAVTATYTSGQQASSVVDALITWAVPGAVVETPFPGVAFPAGTLGADVTVQPGTGMWDPLVDVVDRVGGWVYSRDYLTFLKTAHPTTPAAVPDIHLTVGEGGTILAATSGTSRDGDWASRVLVESTWTDSGGTAHLVRGWAAVSGITYHRTLKVSRDQPTTAAKNQAAATAMLRRAWSRGRTLALDAVAAYWLAPADTVRVTLPNGVTEDSLLSRVTFNPLEGRMSIVTRYPDDLTITTGG